MNDEPLAERPEGWAHGDEIRTVYLGTFPHDDAEAVVSRLVDAGIAWWFKQPGFFSAIWERGIRLFVDRARFDEARAIADRVERERHPDVGGK